MCQQINKCYNIIKLFGFLLKGNSSLHSPRPTNTSVNLNTFMTQLWITKRRSLQGHTVVMLLSDNIHYNTYSFVF